MPIKDIFSVVKVKVVAGFFSLQKGILKTELLAKSLPESFTVYLRLNLEFPGKAKSSARNFFFSRIRSTTQRVYPP